MKDLLTIISNSEDMVELGESKVFKKQLLRFSDWIHPNDPSKKLSVDKSFAQQLVDNFKKRVAGRVPVPVEHWRYNTNDSMANAGELVDLSVEDDGIYGTIEVKRDNVAQDIQDGILFDVSASFDENYQDKESGRFLGPVMRHVALVNKPYIKGLNPFVSLSEQLENSYGASVTLLSEEANQGVTMTKVVNEHDFDVELTITEGDEEVTKTLKAGEELEVADDQLEAVKEQLDKAEKPAEEETEEEETTEETETEETEEEESEEEETEEETEEEEETELSEAEQLRKENEELKAKERNRDIEDNFKTLLSEGYVTPAMKTEFVSLSEQLHDTTVSLSDDEEKPAAVLLSEMLKKKKVVSLDEESGAQTSESTNDDDPVTKLSDEQRAAFKRLGVDEEDYRETVKGLDLSKQE